MCRMREMVNKLLSLMIVKSTILLSLGRGISIDVAVHCLTACFLFRSELEDIGSVSLNCCKAGPATEPGHIRGMQSYLLIYAFNR